MKKFKYLFILIFITLITVIIYQNKEFFVYTYGFKFNYFLNIIEFSSFSVGIYFLIVFFAGIFFYYFFTLSSGFNSGKKQNELKLLLKNEKEKNLKLEKELKNHAGNIEPKEKTISAETKEVEKIDNKPVESIEQEKK